MTCNHESEHEAVVQNAQSQMPCEEDIFTLGNLFKAICEPSRLKILFALRGGELCVYHIVQAVGGTQSAVSHQLRILRDHRIIKARRDGQNSVYSLADAHVLAVLELASAHLHCGE